MKTMMLAMALGTTALGGLAYAQTAEPSATRGDRQSGAAISRADYLARAEARFARLDTNRDGVLSGEERRAGQRMNRRGGRAWERADTDRDGRVSRTEFDVMPAALFARLDANGDGAIDANEAPKGRRGGGRFARFDSDQDSRVTRAEYQTAVDQRFRRFDGNGDGFVSAEERAALAASRAARRGAAGRSPRSVPPPSPTRDR